MKMLILFGEVWQIHVFIPSNNYPCACIHHGSLVDVIWIGLKKPLPLKDKIDIVPIVWLDLHWIKLFVSRTGSVVFLGHDKGTEWYDSRTEIRAR